MLNTLTAMFSPTTAAIRVCSRPPLAAALLAASFAAVPALGQGQAIYSYAAMPNHGFLDVNRPPNCNYPFPTITVSAGGRDVVMTTTNGVDMTPVYYMGCFDWSQTAPNYHDPIDPAVNPGDFRGHTQYGAGGDLILDFSEPLTGFGISSLLENAFFRVQTGETVIVYDGPTGTGNVLGTGSRQHQRTSPARGVSRGRRADAPDPLGAIPMEPIFQIDGYAVGVSTNPCPCHADVNCSGGLTVQDLFDFLAFYFTQDPRGDFNAVGGWSVQDIFDFLAAYFAGCP